MIPAARLSAAIEILDRVLGGAAIDPCLTNWGRANRFAGSGDRAAIRDLVFEAWRCKRSFAALGGGETGRGLMLGWVRATGQDEASLFNAIGHAPGLVTQADAARPATELQSLDCPDWLAPRLQQSLGAHFAPVMTALRTRAPVVLRVNTARISRPDAQALLASEGIETAVHPLAGTALLVTTSTRKIPITKAYLEGLVELQDAASQAVIEALPLADGQRVLDFCAGGGGKTLALAARADVAVWAHDADATRMRDLPARMGRAKAKVTLTTTPAQDGPFDLVLADVPCSGSGSWRRDPAGKWSLTETRLIELLAIQARILDQVAPLVGPKGVLGYVTCSLLADENQHQIGHFLQRHAGWQDIGSRSFTPLSGGDGFFLSILGRNEKQ